MVSIIQFTVSDSGKIKKKNAKHKKDNISCSSIFNIFPNFLVVIYFSDPSSSCFLYFVKF